ncbi:hydratase, partial [Variovorax sp. CT11-76]
FASDGAALDALLARTRLRLSRDGTPIEEGTGANVLDGPLHALLHFLHELQACPGAPALQPGEVVTTGTWTDAWPIAPGQVWRSEFDAPFDGLEVSLR